MPTLRINNSRYAYSNIFFGRILAPLVGGESLLYVVRSVLFGDLGNSGTVVFFLIRLYLIGLMLWVFIRRGRYIAILWIEFDDSIKVGRPGRTDSYEWNDVKQMEYEGVRNPARIDVSNATFPKHDDLILVITLKDEKELRIRVGKEHDSILKQFVPRIAKIEDTPSSFLFS